MNPIYQEQRIEVLREMALLLDRENRRLHQRIQDLISELSAVKGESDAAALQLELDALRELLSKRDRSLFGDSSERRPSPVEGEPDAPETKPQSGHGPRQQDQLPIQPVHHLLAEASRQCPACGGRLEEMGEQTEDAEEVTVVERRFVLAKHVRQKYRCRCNGAVVTAPGPKKLTPGGRYSPEFAVEVATSKYLDHLPLERQCRIMQREGLRIDSQTLWDQLEALAAHLEPTYLALGERVRRSPVLQADETHWRLMSKSQKKRYWVWCLASSDTAWYRIFESRSKEAARSMLKDYRGTVVADGYGASEALARAAPSFRLAHCWNHVRRRFVEAEPHNPLSCREILDLIGKLYAIEGSLPACHGADGTEMALELRGQLRQEQSRPVVAEIRTWAHSQKVLPRSAIGQAIRYMLELWPGLTCFLDDPAVPLDTNPVERALRGVVIGRKNHYGSRSRRGCEVAALFYSLFESAKLCGIEPKAYVLRATREALEHPGSATLPRLQLL